MKNCVPYTPVILNIKGKNTHRSQLQLDVNEHFKVIYIHFLSVGVWCLVCPVKLKGVYCKYGRGSTSSTIN